MQWVKTLLYKDGIYFPVSSTCFYAVFFFLQAVTLHTDLGEIKIELFCERSPKSCEVRGYRKYIKAFISSLLNTFCVVIATSCNCCSNILLQNFLALCASGFYNDCTFHRNIKGFMVQTGDPTGM